MDLVKALLVFFVLTGCTEVVSELPLGRAAIGLESRTKPAADSARLGPPNPRGSSARRIDQAAKPAVLALY